MYVSQGTDSFIEVVLSFHHGNQELYLDCQDHASVALTSQASHLSGPSIVNLKSTLTWVRLTILIYISLRKLPDTATCLWMKCLWVNPRKSKWMASAIGSQVELHAIGKIRKKTGIVHRRFSEKEMRSVFVVFIVLHSIQLLTSIGWTPIKNHDHFQVSGITMLLIRTFFHNYIVQVISFGDF